RDRPELGQLTAGYEDELEARLRNNLPGDVSGATISAAIRILERHGMLRRDPETERLVATRPTESTAGLYPPLDVESLQRRAEVERGKLRTMVELAYYPRCRRQFVLEYFGDQEWASRERQCGACDNCEAILNGRATGLSETDRQSIINLLKLVGALNGRFGRKRIAGVANGTDLDERFLELPERNTLRAWPENRVLDLLRALEGAGLVEASRGEYPTISTTRKGDQVAFGRLDPAELGIQVPTVGAKRKRKR
ncbi:MAG TPA: RecQ family zinc-binding domain-containing protein, partial [Polyangiaceae bacterium]|nr:RecQ family zinc-binding domain-containing protein [Polyangiaceae bacterium]